MLSVLLKKQLIEKISFFKRDRKHTDIVGIFLSIVLMALVIFIEVKVFSMFVEKYCAVRIDNVLDVKARQYEIIAIIYELTIVIGFFSSTAALNYAIFENDDRNILITLPIKSSTIFFSKLIVVYLKQVILALCITVPLIIVFDVVTKQDASFIILSIIMGFFLPTFSLSVASILCLPYYYFKRFFQSRYILLLIIITALMFLCSWGYSRLLSFLETFIATGEIKFIFSGKMMSKIISTTRVLAPANFIAKLVLGIKPWQNFGILTLILLFFNILGYSIVYILYNSAVKARAVSSGKIFFVRRKVRKLQSIKLSLLSKEFGLILFTPDYAMQYFSVAAIMPLMVYFCIHIGSNLLSSIVLVECNFELAIFLVILFGALTNTFAATNISRDGRAFYLQKTMPIKYSDVIWAKIFLNMIICTLSVAISSIVLGACGYVGASEGLFVFAIGLIMGLSQICIATRLDLNYPRFSEEEDNVVRESNNNVSIIVIWGIVSAILLGGIPLYLAMKNELVGKASSLFTYLFTGIAALIILTVSLTYLFFRLRSRFDKLSEGD